MASPLPPLVAELVADTAQYEAAMTRSTESMERFAAMAEASGERVDMAWMAMADAALRADEALAGVAERSAAASEAGVAANQAWAESFLEVGTAAEMAAAEATAAQEGMAGADAETISANAAAAASFGEEATAAEGASARVRAAKESEAAGSEAVVGANAREAASQAQTGTAAEGAAATVRSAKASEAESSAGVVEGNLREAESFRGTATAAEQAGSSATLSQQRMAAAVGMTTTELAAVQREWAMLSSTVAATAATWDADMAGMSLKTATLSADMGRMDATSVRGQQAAEGLGAAWSGAGIKGRTAGEEMRAGAQTAGDATATLGQRAVGMRDAVVGAAGAATDRFGLMGLAIGGVGAETVKMASTFDQKMELLVTMAHKPQPEIDGLKDKVLSLAGQTAQAPNDLADAFYHLVSSGMSTDQAMTALKSSAQLATTGVSDLNTTAYALAGIMSAAPKDIQNTDQAVAMMSTTVGTGDMSMQDLSTSIRSGLLPTMVSAGMGFKDMAAGLATMTDNSMPAQMAANRLRTSILMMQNPPKTAASALQDLGLSQNTLADDMAHGGLQQAIVDLSNHMKDLKPRAGDVALSLDEINKRTADFRQGMLDDGASVQQADAASAKYRETLTTVGPAGERAVTDVDKAFGGSRSAGTILTLTDETGKLIQKYDALGTPTQQAADFQQHFSDTMNTTAAKARAARDGLEALGIKIGEDLTPVANHALDAITWLGSGLEQGGLKARVLATVIEGVAGVTLTAYIVKMAAAAASTVAWAASGLAAGARWSWGLIKYLNGVEDAWGTEAAAAEEANNTEAASTQRVVEAIQEQTAAIREALGAQQEAQESETASVQEATEAQAASLEERTAAYRAYMEESENAVAMGEEAQQVAVEQAQAQMVEITETSMTQLVAAVREGMTEAAEALRAGMTEGAEAVREGMAQEAETVRTYGNEVVVAAQEVGEQAAESQTTIFVESVRLGAQQGEEAAQQAITTGQAQLVAAAEEVGTQAGQAEGQAFTTAARTWVVNGEGQVAAAVTGSSGELVTAARTVGTTAGEAEGVALGTAARTSLAAGQEQAALGIGAGQAQLTTAATTAGRTAGEAEGEAFGTAVKPAMTTAEAAAGAGLEAGAAGLDAEAAGIGRAAGVAEGEAVATGLGTTGAAIGAAGAGAATTGAVATKRGWLGNFGKTAGEVGLVLVGADFIEKAVTGLSITDQMHVVADNINRFWTGKPLDPSTSALQATFNQWTDSLRTSFGMAKQYTDDGTRAISAGFYGMQQNAANAENGTIQSVNQMGTGIMRALDNLPPEIKANGQRTWDGYNDAQKLGIAYAAAGAEKLPPQLQQALANLPPDVRAQGIAAWNGMDQATRDGVAATIASGRGLPPQLQSAIQPMIGDLQKVGADAWNRMDQATKDGVAAAAVAAGALPPSVTASVGPLPADVQAKGKQAWDAMDQATKDGVVAAAKTSGTLPPFVAQAIAPTGPALAQGAQGDWQGYVGATKQGVTDSANAARDLPNQMRSALSGVKNELTNDGNDEWGAYRDATARGVTAAEQEAGKLEAGIRTATVGIEGDLRISAQRGWQGYLDVTTQETGQIVQTVQNMGRDVDTALQLASTTDTQTWRQSWLDIAQATTDGAAQVEAITARIPPEIEAQFANLPAQMRNIGILAMEGLAQGIDQEGQVAVQHAEQIAMEVQQIMRMALMINSPSEVMRQLGQFTMQGFGVGIHESGEDVLSYLDDFAKQVADTFHIPVKGGDIDSWISQLKGAGTAASSSGTGAGAGAASTGAGSGAAASQGGTKDLQSELAELAKEWAAGTLSISDSRIRQVLEEIFGKAQGDKDDDWLIAHFGGGPGGGGGVGAPAQPITLTTDQRTNTLTAAERGYGQSAGDLHVHVAGSVIDAQGLLAIVQQEALKYGYRNPTSGLTVPRR